MYIQSDYIKMYPTPRRDSNIDPHAKLLTEYNIINIVNRLTNIDSFVIDGLNVSDDGTTVNLSAGSCNIHGYYFNLNDTLTIVDVSKNKTYLCLAIRFNININGMGQLSFFDDNDNYQYDSLDAQVFRGLSIDSYDNLAPEGDDTYKIFKLPLAILNDNIWEDYVADDGTSGIELKRISLLKYNASDISIISGMSGNDYIDKQQDLTTFLKNNYVIDDGEVT